MELTNIFILSDSVGETADHFARSVMIQYHNKKFEFRRKAFVTSIEMLDEVILEAKHCNAIIAYTLIKSDMRAHLKRRATELDIFIHNVFGTFFVRLEEQYGLKPSLELGLNHRLDEDYFKRIEAIEFSVQYDDARDPRGVLKADIVLIGVSRTSKTPLSQFLAHKGYKVANIPIIYDVEPPEELFQVDPKKCIGLNNDPEKLIAIRKERLKSMGLSESSTYSDTSRILMELEYFQDIVKKVGCKVVDVSNSAIEETATKVIELIDHEPC